MSRYSQPYLAGRLVLSDGRVIDFYGKVMVWAGIGPDLYGDEELYSGSPPARLEVELSANQFSIYLPGQQAPEHPPEQYRSLTSGAPAFPTEVVDGEILPED